MRLGLGGGRHAECLAHGIAAAVARWWSGYWRFSAVFGPMLGGLIVTSGHLALDLLINLPLGLAPPS